MGEKMKKIFVFVLITVFLVFTSTAIADDFSVPEDPGGLFLVDIDGDRVVLQFYGSEQAWQYVSPDTPGWHQGLAPHPFDHKIWYPHLEDSQGMDLDEQLAWIDALEYAGIDKWRIGTFWDTIPLKASIFGGIPDLTGPNPAFGYDTTAYFPITGFTATGPGLTFARTGNEPCGDDPFCDGAVIEVGPAFGFHWENYPVDGLQVVPGDGMTGLEVWEEESGPVEPNGRYIAANFTAEELAMFPEILDTAYYNTEYYALPRSHAQDHWAIMGPMCMYDKDINSTADYLPYGSMVGQQPMGAWTVTEKWPVLGKDAVHTVTIHGVVNPFEGGLPAGTLVPVEILMVQKNKKAPAPVIDYDGATITFGPSDYKTNVYHIQFEYEGVVHVFKVKLD
jgi:hypothetical protein